MEVILGVKRSYIRVLYYQYRSYIRVVSLIEEVILEYFITFYWK